MMTDYASQRKQYVSEVRNSFEQSRTEEAEPQPGLERVGMRLRLAAAVCLFLVFFYCHSNGVTFAGYTTGKMIDMVADNRYDTILQEYGIIPEYGTSADQTAAKE